MVLQYMALLRAKPSLHEAFWHLCPALPGYNVLVEFDFMFLQWLSLGIMVLVATSRALSRVKDALIGERRVFSRQCVQSTSDTHY